MEKDIIRPEKGKKAVGCIRCVFRPRGTEYCLLREVNEEGTVVYTVTVRGEDGESCRLPDVARRRESAEYLFSLFVGNELSANNAAEVVEELLAREPSLFV
ncbi:MAG: hypothetical protein IJ009_04605 [Clostridia bacterium]|nr:hypothetical protein [Clostridia bacterium]MBQ8858159.1 hypothetical protein [Clostridia bacterium]